MTLKTILVAENELRAEFLRTLLRNEGIECMLKSNTLSKAKAPQTTIDILVLEEDEEKAKTILSLLKIV